MEKEVEALYNSAILIDPDGDIIGRYSKTHFAQAIALDMQKTSEKKVCYISAEAFMQEFVSSLKTNCIGSFKYKYRKEIDVLIRST